MGVEKGGKARKKAERKDARKQKKEEGESCCMSVPFMCAHGKGMKKGKRRNEEDKDEGDGGEEGSAGPVCTCFSKDLI